MDVVMPVRVDAFGQDVPTSCTVGIMSVRVRTLQSR